MTNEDKEQETNDAVNGRVDPLVMRYQHDCTNCKPIGQYKEYDIYFCNIANDTVVARYGNNVDEYNSGIHLTGLPQIKVAVSMAKAAGYIDA